MYAAVRQAKLKPGVSDDVIKRARDGALPLISGAPGFKGYYMILGDDDTITTVSLFEDKLAAEKCNTQVLGWIKENMGPYLASPAQATDGRVVIQKP